MMGGGSGHGGQAQAPAEGGQSYAQPAQADYGEQPQQQTAQAAPQ